MQARIGKWGNSLALRIPRSVANKAGLSFDATVELSLRKHELVVSLAKPPRTELERLLADVTDDNRHGEVDTGRPVGGEVW
ncbi:MAG: AbrB/MazE/SpoVT family DNA-binding domain-containing protein [Gammaproteobacteria bacterium]|nr:AbrB/MazE/SpoVT family DNA-binding domain-containing protein [Gammaproteobacteria bacterium]